MIIMSTFYCGVGIAHFMVPENFLIIIPPYLPYKLELVYISGFFEILFGLLMSIVIFNEFIHFLILRFKKNNFLQFIFLSKKSILKYKYFYSYGLIFLLIAVFPANYYLYKSEIARESYGFITQNQAFVRMLFQPLLIITAYWHGNDIENKKIAILFLCISIISIIYFVRILI